MGRSSGFDARILLELQSFEPKPGPAAELALYGRFPGAGWFRGHRIAIVGGVFTRAALGLAPARDDEEDPWEERWGVSVVRSPDGDPDGLYVVNALKGMLDDERQGMRPIALSHEGGVLPAGTLRVGPGGVVFEQSYPSESRPPFASALPSAQLAAHGLVFARYNPPACAL